MGTMYVVICNSEDGDVYIQLMSRGALQHYLADISESCAKFFGEDDIPSHPRDFANEMPLGCLILKADNIIVPKAVERVTKYEID